MTRAHGKLGKLDPEFPEGLLDLTDYLSATAPLPAPPSWVNWERYMPQSPNHWPMDGNDRYGDCVTAAIAHQMQSWNFETHESDPIPTQQQVINEYLALTGGKDTGLVISRTLNTWHTTGLWGNKIAAYAPVDYRNMTQMKQAIAFYGGVFAGIQLPANALTQFDNGKPWALETGWRNEKIIGGHCVPLLAYNAERLYCVTWGQVQPVSWAWLYAYGDEAWVALAQEFVEAGHANGLNVTQLQADIASI